MRLEGAVLGSGNVIVGFSPAGAAPRASNGATGKPGAAATPFGLFDAILALIAASGETGGLNAGTEAATKSARPANAGPSGKPNVTPDFASLLQTTSDPGSQPVAPPDAQAAFADLLQALLALSESIASGTAPDPALEAKVAGALDELAGLLGLPESERPATDSILAAAGATPSPGAGAAEPESPAAPGNPDQLVAIAHAAAQAEAPARTTPSAPEPGQTGIPGTTAPSAPGGTAAAPPMEPEINAAAATDSGEAEGPEAPAPRPEAKPVPPVAHQLAERISELAAALETRVPGLAKRLTALAEKLSSGDLDAETFAKLGIDAAAKLSEEDIAAAVDRLLGASREVKGAPAPQAFAAARLALPDLLAPHDGKPPAGQRVSSENPPPAEAARPTPPADTELPREPVAESRAAARPDKPEPTTNARPGFSAAFQSRPDASEPPQPQAPTGVSATTPTAAAPVKLVHAAYSAPVRQINIPQIAFEIVRQVEAGASRFQIRLDPPELGRVDVKLEVDAAGNVKARMTVERAETLDLMQRDQRTLERALAQAGLDSAKTNLEFSLRQNPFARDGQGHNGGNGNGGPYSSPGGPSETDDTAAAAQLVAYRSLASPGGVNLFV